MTILLSSRTLLLFGVGFVIASVLIALERALFGVINDELAAVFLALIIGLVGTSLFYPLIASLLTGNGRDHH